MADLIIKPSSGGSLKLQEDGGTDAISINTSGVATLANATITAGTFPANMVLQVFNVLSTTQSSITNTNSIIMTKTFNRKKGNSHFIVSALVSMAPIPNDGSMDTCDPSLSFFVNGSAVVTNDTITRDGFYRSDVPNWRNDVTTNGRYDVYQQGITVDFTHISSGSDNDSVTIAVDLYAGSGGAYINRSQQSTASGGCSSLTIWEVAS